MAVADTMNGKSDEADLVQDIAGLKSQFDVFRFLKRLSEIYRSRTFMVCNLPQTMSADLQSITIVTNWPPELMTAYDQEGLMLDSPFIRRLRNSTIPFLHTTAEIRSDGDDDKREIIASLLERFRMPCSACFPVHDASGTRGCVCFSGDREDFTRREMTELSYLSIHIYERLAKIRHMDTQLTETLTDREIDCLSWTAAGKTSSDIADIVGLSEHTVNQYLNRAARKLDTVNRTQAVAKALRIGLIK